MLYVLVYATKSDILCKQRECTALICSRYVIDEPREQAGAIFSLLLACLASKMKGGGGTFDG